MKIIDRILFYALLCFLGAAGFTMLAPPAKAQTVTQFWQLTMDGKPLQENSTQAYCHAAAKASAKHPEVAASAPTVVLDCIPRLRVSGLVAPVVPPVIPPVVTPPPTGSWVIGPSSAAEPTTPLPAKGVSAPDPTFKTPVYRVSERGEPPSGFARNDYSRRQAFNAGATRQLVAARDGFWHTYNAVSFAYEKRLSGPAGDAEPQWHPTNPDLLYYLPTSGLGMKVLELNVAANTSRQVADLGPRIKARWPGAAAAWTRSEGSPSADGRYWCFMVDDGSWRSLGVVVWDMQGDVILGFLNTNGSRPDHVSMSPSGRYCVTSHVEKDPGTVAWARDFSTSRKLFAGSEHSDLSIAADGSDVYVAIDYGSNAGDVFMVNLDTGVRTALFPTYIAGSATAVHFSGKGYGAPGWVLVTAQASSGAKQWMHRKIFLQELKAGGRVLNVAWHRSTDGNYFAAPVASLSRDGARVAFTSSWGGTADSDINAFQARLPPIPK